MSQTAAAGAQPETSFRSAFEHRLERLKMRIPPGQIKQREGWRDKNGNAHMVDYVEWHTVADILDEHAPKWTHTVSDIREIGDIVTVTVAIEIDGVTRQGIGTGAAASELGIKKAEHDALKRAAVKFGIARELYKKETALIEREGSTARNSSYNPSLPPNPDPRNSTDVVTAKQLGMIRAIAREAGVDPDTECAQIWEGLTTSDISRRAASFLIDHLKALQASAGDEPAGAPPKREAPKSAPAAAGDKDKKMIAAWRTSIEQGLRDIGTDPAAALGAFDGRCDTLLKKQTAHSETMKHVAKKKAEQLIEAMAGQNWDEADIGREMKKYGIEHGFDSASEEQIGRMWAEYKKARMF